MERTKRLYRHIFVRTYLHTHDICVLNSAKTVTGAHIVCWPAQKSRKAVRIDMPGGFRFAACMNCPPRVMFYVE